MEGSKSRHGCLTALLVVMIIASSLSALMYLFGSEIIRRTYPDAAGWTFTLLIILSLFNIVCAIALLQWKKWGFWGFCASSIVALFINISIGLGIGYVIYENEFRLISDKSEFLENFADIGKYEDIIAIDKEGFVVYSTVWNKNSHGDFINSDIGRVIYTTISAFAEMERKRILQRCNEGRERAKANGKHLGRAPDHELHEQIKNLAGLGRNKHAISKELGCSRTTVYKVLG